MRTLLNALKASMHAMRPLELMLCMNKELMICDVQANGSRKQGKHEYCGTSTSRLVYEVFAAANVTRRACVVHLACGRLT
jgi:hypothetical protein